MNLRRNWKQWAIRTMRGGDRVPIGAMQKPIPYADKLA